MPESERPLAPHALPGTHAIVMPPRGFGAMSQRFLEVLRWLRSVFDGDRLSLALARHHEADDELRLLQLEWLSAETNIPLVATNDPRCHVRERQPLQDVVSCIRANCTLRQARRRAVMEPFDLAAGRVRTSAAVSGVTPHAPTLLPNDEWHLKSARAMDASLAPVPVDIRHAAMERSARIAAHCGRFSMSELKYRYPSEIVPPGRTPMEYLCELTWKGAAERYPAGIPAAVRTRVQHEFDIISDLDYPSYFLTVHSIVAFAKSQGILCQGRGAAANSAVCYCLGITAVDPSRIDMLFERFISRERNEPPDIDVDFEHERREEVIQYIYRTYGRSRAALCAEVVSYRTRSAMRDVLKVLEEPECEVEDAPPQVAALVEQLHGFPRHLSQHVGGFIITEDPLCELVPVRNATMDERTIVEWDKDDVDAMGMLKMDVLALGMLSAISKALKQLGRNEFGMELFSVPPEDPAVYEMCSRADTIGVFQIESRAQMSMLPRLRPKCFYDLVVEVAIVRPGPIQGDMVHPYLRRRNGEEPINYPNDVIRRVLGRTMGVPLFQEQAMALAVEAAGFTPGEADQLRRAIAAWKRSGAKILAFRDKLERGMLQRGYTREFAQQVFTQIQGFSGYGFPESHAASFALLVYVSAWLKLYHPAAFAAALINSQPMGFYAPAQLVRDAREHGVEVRGVDVHCSRWDCTLEDDANAPALRLGLRIVSGIRQDDACAIVDAVRRHGSFGNVESLWRAAACSMHALRKLALADAFASMGLTRQQALWQIRALRDTAAPVLDHAAEQGATLFDMRPQPLPPVTARRQVAQDYASTGLSLKAHPVEFVRSALEQRGVRPCADVLNEDATQPGDRVSIAGLVLCRQRPATASGIVFITVEDETGAANLIVRNKVYERHRLAARDATLLMATGRVERKSGVTHLLVQRMEDLSHTTEVQPHSRDFH
jgi:error-prone DNA polymerase